MRCNQSQQRKKNKYIPFFLMFSEARETRLKKEKKDSKQVKKVFIKESILGEHS